ncbi:hypothetical protein PV783_24745 [Chitinophaga sp. CC14]|uniref:hypothetical protein n=1 Tax=Chitinophaga sp. CC14 TaxID=3029199 RepID=UPI003B7B391E
METQQVGGWMELLLDLEDLDNKYMKNIRIEKVGDINSEYPYLEIFKKNDDIPFLEVSISEKKELSFKFYASQIDILLDIYEWEYILETAKEFLPQALKDEDDYEKFLNK